MDELAIYKRQGYGGKSGFGERPAAILVDFVNGFADPELFGGGNINAAIEKTSQLLPHLRAADIPIAYTRVVYAEDGSDTGVFCLKSPKLASLTEQSPSSQIVDALSPKKGDCIICKTQPSAFFGTGLLGWLINNRVDTLIVTGCTTSGCVRATAVDSMSNNFKTIVVSDCVGDRAIAPHEANLFDMEQKCADLMTSAELVKRISSLTP